mgnify:CR=1 FL=1
MRSLTSCLILVALCACRNDPNTTPNDLTSTPVVDQSVSEDLTGAPKAVTIRDLNGGSIGDNTVVATTGVVTSPILWIDTFAASGTSPPSCRFNLFIAQPDAQPTLKDGLRVTRSLSAPQSDAGTVSVSACRTLGAADEAYKAMAALKPGDAVEVSGRFNISANTQQRSLAVTTAAGVVGKGAAPMAPLPATVTSAMLTESDTTAFRAAQSALVRLDNVTVVDSGVASAAAFSATSDGTAKTPINTQYITTTLTGDMMYAPPANTTKIKAIVGIVFPEGKGSVRPRNTGDIQPQ